MKLPIKKKDMFKYKSCVALKKNKKMKQMQANYKDLKCLCTLCTLITFFKSQEHVNLSLQLVLKVLKNARSPT